jgi:hypothetical protein
MPRGECKIWSLTYSVIAKWTGLRVVTVRNCASRGDFDPRDIESVLGWANARRQRLGLPLIGVPDGDNQVASDDAPTTTSAPAPPEMYAVLSYNSRRGCFQENFDT